MAFPKALLILPVIMMTQKINFDDPNLIMILRILYFTLHISFLLFLQYLKQKIIAKNDTRVIYVPPQKQAFGTEGTSFQKTTYLALELERCSSVSKQTLVAMGFASFLHFKIGIKPIMLLQSLLQPANWIDEPLVKKYIFGSTERVYNEKFEGEQIEAEVVDTKKGKDEKVTEPQTIEKEQDIKQEPSEKPRADEGETTLKIAFHPELEEALEIAWDAGQDADFSNVMKHINAENVNYQTSENSWSPLMIASGIQSCSSFIPQLLVLGANPKLKDAEGWTALHWAVYHESMDSVKELIKCHNPDILNISNNEGKTPLDFASANEKILQVLKSLSSEDISSID